MRQSCRGLCRGGGHGAFCTSCFEVGRQPDFRLLQSFETFSLRDSARPKSVELWNIHLRTFGTYLVATHTFDTFTVLLHALNDLTLHDGVLIPHSEPFASVRNCRILSLKSSETLIGEEILCLCTSRRDSTVLRHLVPLLLLCWNKQGEVSDPQVGWAS